MAVPASKPIEKEFEETRSSSSSLIANFWSPETSPPDPWELTIPSVLLVNILCFYLLSELEIFAPVRESLFHLSRIFAWAISTLFILIYLPKLYSRIRDLFGVRSVVVEIATFASIILSFIAALYSEFLQTPHGIFYTAPIALALVASGLSIYLWLDRWFQYLLESRYPQPFGDESSHAIILESGGIERKVPVRDIAIGSVFRAKAGSIVPCDGLVLNGSTEVRERKLTGLNLVKFKAQGDQIFAGTEILGDTVDCKATARFDDSFITSFREELNRSSAGLREASLQTERVELMLASMLLCLAIAVSVYWFASGSPVRGLSSAATIACIVLAFSSLTLVRVAIRSVFLGWFANGIICKDFAKALAAIGKTNVFAIDFVPAELPGRSTVLGFTLVDERIEKDSLVSVLLSILARSEEESHISAVEYLRSLVRRPQVFTVAELCSYGGGALSALVQGVDFSIGPEAFLIERGVQLQPSEIDAGSLYVAMGDELVAELLFSPKFTRDAEDLAKSLRGLQVRTVLLGMEKGDALDRTAKSIGLELADGFGEMKLEEYRDRLSALNEVLFYTNNRTPQEVISARTLTCSSFDELRWDVQRTDITLFSSSLSLISYLFSSQRRLSQVIRQSYYFAGGLSGLLLILSIAGALSAPLVILAEILGLSFIYLNIRRGLI